MGVVRGYPFHLGLKGNQKYNLIVGPAIPTQSSGSAQVWPLGAPQRGGVQQLTWGCRDPLWSGASGSQVEAHAFCWVPVFRANARLFNPSHCQAQLTVWQMVAQTAPKPPLYVFPIPAIKKKTKTQGREICVRYP